MNVAQASHPAPPDLGNFVSGVPLHPELRRRLRQLHRESGGDGPLIRSARGGTMRANSIVNWFVAIFAELGFDGGRRGRA
jgi:hypothetical protein